MYSTPTHAASMRIYPQEVRETVRKVYKQNAGRMQYASGHLEYLFNVYNTYLQPYGETPQKLNCGFCVATVTTTIKKYVAAWDQYGIEEKQL